MLFSQVTSFTLFFLGIGSAVASPTPNEAAIIARQSKTDIQVVSILTTLQGQNNNTLSQITNLMNAGNANDVTILPLITKLVDNFNTTTSMLGTVSPSHRHLKRDVVMDVTDLLASIIMALVTTLNTLMSVNTILTMEVLHSAVDVALKALLVKVNILVYGVLVPLQGLLTSVSAILMSLGFVLTTRLLGL